MIPRYECLSCGHVIVVSAAARWPDACPVCFESRWRWAPVADEDDQTSFEITYRGPRLG